MPSRFLDSIATFVTTRRRLVLLVVAGLVAFWIGQLPKLQTDASAENLIISYGGYQERVSAFQRDFGDPDSVALILIEADDVLTQPVLQYVHDLARHFQASPDVVRVESLTTTPMPMTAGDTETTLDDLGDETEQAINEDAPGDVPPEVQAALNTLVESDPARFPMGLYTIADRVGDGSSDVTGVVRDETVDVDDVETLKKAIENAPLVQGRLISRNHRLASVVLFLDPAIGTGNLRLETVHRINGWLSDHAPPAGVEVHGAGLPHLRAAISDAMLADQALLVPLSLLICVVLLTLSFRWVGGTVLPLAVVGIAVIGVLGTMAAVGEPLTVLLNTLPTLMIVMGISEAVHVVGRYLEEVRRAPNRIVAAQRTARQLAVACFLTSFTTAIGFAALLVARTEMLRHFGLIAALGVMLTYVLIVTFAPAAISLFPLPKRATARADHAQRGWLEAWLIRGTSFLIARPKRVLLVTAMVAGVCIWGSTKVRNDTALLDTFDARDPIAISTRLVERELEGIRPLQIVLSAEGEGAMLDPETLTKMDELAAWARTREGVLRASTPTDTLWEVWRRLAGIGLEEPRTPFASRTQVEALRTLLGRIEPNPLHSWITPDARRARVELRLGDVGAQRSMELIRAIEDEAHRRLGSIPGVTLSTLGEAYIGSHGIDAVVRDTGNSLGLSAIVIFLTIALLFRNWKLGVLAIPPNTLPQIAAAAWMALRGIPLDASTAIVFSVAIGVTVDLTIHGFARLVEEEERGLSRRAAIVRGARSTGRAIVVSCATLVMGFGVLLWSGFVPVRHFGELLAVALGFSLISTLFVQPALLVMFGPKLKAKQALSP